MKDFIKWNCSVALWRIKKAITNEFYHAVILPVGKFLWKIKFFIIIGIIVILIIRAICNFSGLPDVGPITEEDKPPSQIIDTAEIEKRARIGFVPEKDFLGIKKAYDRLKHTYPKVETVPSFIPSPATKEAVRRSVNIKQFGHTKGKTWFVFTKPNDETYRLYPGYAKTHHNYSAVATEDSVLIQSDRPPLFSTLGYFDLTYGTTTIPEGFQVNNIEAGITLAVIFRPIKTGLIAKANASLINQEVRTGLIYKW